MDIQNGQFEVIEFEHGDTLFMEGEVSYHFYIVQAGDVEIFKTMATGKKVPLAIVGEGGAIGEFAMIDRKPRSATARALTQGVAVKVSEEAYQKLLNELPEWAFAIMSSLVTRVRHTNDIIRKAGIVDDRIREEIETLEFTAKSGDTITEDSPYLRSDEGPDDEDMP